MYTQYQDKNCKDTFSKWPKADSFKIITETSCKPP